MALNVTYKSSELIVDKFNLITNRDALEKDDIFTSHGDCIGLTADAYIAYEYRPFIDAVKNCFVKKITKKGKMYIQGYRHPYHFTRDYNDMSKDNIT